MAPKMPSVAVQEVKIRSNDKKALSPQKEKLAYIIFVLTTAGMLIGSLIHVDSWVVASLGAMAICLFGILNDRRQCIYTAGYYGLYVS